MSLSRIRRGSIGDEVEEVLVFVVGESFGSVMESMDSGLIQPVLEVGIFFMLPLMLLLSLLLLDVEVDKRDVDVINNFLEIIAFLSRFIDRFFTPELYNGCRPIVDDDFVLAFLIGRGNAEAKKI